MSYTFANIELSEYQKQKQICIFFQELFWLVLYILNLL